MQYKLKNIHIKLHSQVVFLEQLQERVTMHDDLQAMWHSIILWGVENPEEFKYTELFINSPFPDTFHTEKSLNVYKEFQIQIIKAILPDTLCKEYPDFVLRYIDNSVHAATRFLLNNDVEDTPHFIDSAFDMIWLGFSFHDKD